VTTSGDMTSAPASALVRALRAREIGSRELLDAYLDRIEQVNPAINAVVTIDAEAARAAAAAADEQIARGQELGALHGLPMTVKDALETAGMRTTSGFPDLAQYVPARDADAVARLRGQGAVILGKTDLPTFAMTGRPTTPSSVRRTIRGT
jgi:amidase